MIRRGFSRLILVVGLVFALAMIAFVALVLRWSETWAIRQLDSEIAAEVADLAAFYDQRRALALTELVQERSVSRPTLGAVYLFTHKNSGARLAGNVRRWPLAAQSSGTFEFPLVDADENATGLTIRARAIVLNESFNLLVGRTIEPRLALASDFARLLPWIAGIFALLGLAACFAIGHAMLGRVEAINDAARAVENGALKVRAPGADRADEFGDLAQHINRMLDRLDALYAATKSTTDRIAHELRTPVTRLRAKLRAASESADGRTRDIIAEAVEETLKLSALYDALLDLSQLEARAGDSSGLVKLDLKPLVEEAAELYVPAAEEKGVKIEVDCKSGVCVRCDRMLLLRLIANLLDNALKFSPAKSRIILSCKSDERHFTLLISDEGPGTGPEFLSQAFEPFARSAEAFKVEGFGLGLAIVKAIAKRHSFSIRLINNAPGLTVEIAGDIVHDMAAQN